MRQNSLLFILSISLVFLPIIVSGARIGAPTATGAWEVIENIHNPHVTEIANFAVAEYDKKAKAGLKFQEVVKGEKQVVSGINYRLVLKAKDGSSSKSYEAVVLEKAWENFKELTSFNVVKA